MRRLAGLMRRPAASRRAAGPLDLTAEMRRPGEPSGDGPGEPADLERLSREIGIVAAYVGRLKGDIGTLKPGQLHIDTLPSARADLDGTREATRVAVDVIMAAAEAILQAASAGDATEAAAVAERKSMEIIEACSFQDIAGQRLVRAASRLSAAERRLERFAKAVRIADRAEKSDRDAILREARREVLLVEGPQDPASAIAQDDVDRLFR